MKKILSSLLVCITITLTVFECCAQSDKKASSLPLITTLDGTEDVIVLQGGGSNANKRVKVSTLRFGLITGISTGTGLTGGPITTSGTIALANTAVTPGSYGTSTSVPQITVDAQGRLISVSNVSISTGTVTNVTGTAPISVATGSTTPAISISQANTTTNGYLSSADWNTFNGKQGALTLTTTGTSGAATLVGTTLNIPTIPGSIPGMVMYWTTTTAPTGWLACDGSAVSRTTYSDLFAVIGTTFGIGNGSTTFNLPLSGGNFVASYTSGDSDYNAINKTGGQKTHTLTTSEIPSHSHTYVDDYLINENGGAAEIDGKQNIASGYAGTSSGSLVNPATWLYYRNGTTNNTGSGTAHENRPPFITLLMIIKY